MVCGRIITCTGRELIDLILLLFGLTVRGVALYVKNNFIQYMVSEENGILTLY